MKKIRHFVTRPGRNGTPRNFWQPSSALRAQGWMLKRLSDDPIAAVAEAEAENAKLDAWRRGAVPAHADGTPKRRVKAKGSLASLIVDYKASPYYGGLDASTRRSYDWALALVEDWAGDRPVKSLTPKQCRDLYDSFADDLPAAPGPDGKATAARPGTPAKAALLIRVLRVVLGKARLLYAKDHPGWIDDHQNPARHLSIPSLAKKGRLWTPAAVAAFVAMADAMGRHSLGTAAVLNEWLGQREGDLIRLGWSAYKDGALRLVQNKTGAEVELPVDLVPSLFARLEAERARQRTWSVQPMTVIAFEPTRQPYNEHTFRHEFAAVRAAAVKGDPDKGLLPCPDLDGMLFMHFRHTAVTRMAEAGVSVPGIAGVTGHSMATAQAIIDRYLVRTRQLAIGAFTTRLAAQDAEKNGS